jgi:hypothetical protein
MGTVFAIMPFDVEFRPLFDGPIKRAAAEAGLDCVRGDTPRDPGIIMDQVRSGIRESRMCVADLSGQKANVMLEVGLALSMSKPLIFVTRDELSTLPFNIAHYRVHRYDPHDVAGLESALTASLKATLKSDQSDGELLRMMLAPKNTAQDVPFVVAASPLSYRAARKSIANLDYVRSTYGDHVGIRGIIQSLGILFGRTRLPELVDPGDFTEDFLERDDTAMHLFCIASPKSNRWTRQVLQRMFERRLPRLAFAADPGSRDLTNVHVILNRDDGNGPLRYSPPHYNPKEESYGVIVRGAYPEFPRHMRMVLAGGSALGTHAACLAATSPNHINEIRSQLAKIDVDLAESKQGFWAVAAIKSRTVMENVSDADPSTLRVLSVEAFR